MKETTNPRNVWCRFLYMYIWCILNDQLWIPRASQCIKKKEVQMELIVVSAACKFLPMERRRHRPCKIQNRYGDGQYRYGKAQQGSKNDSRRIGQSNVGLCTVWCEGLTMQLVSAHHCLYFITETFLLCITLEMLQLTLLPPEGKETANFLTVLSQTLD